jgi:hypothetical protein
MPDGRRWGGRGPGQGAAARAQPPAARRRLRARLRADGPGRPADGGGPGGLRQVLVGHLPYPAVVVDRAWNLVDANAAVAVLVGLADPALLAPPVNVLWVSLHTARMDPLIVNLGEWRAPCSAGSAARSPSPPTPGCRAVPGAARLSLRPARAGRRGPGPGDVVVPLRLRHGPAPGRS